MRRPDDSTASASGAPGKRPSLDEILKESARRAADSGRRRSQCLVELGGRYLTQADALAADRSPSRRSRMRLNSIRLLNFRQHADTCIAFEWTDRHHRRERHGKSTILEAIAWALYGNRGPRNPRVDQVPRAPPRAPVRVELDFELGAHRYRVIRSLTNAELYLDRGAAPIANSTSGVTEVFRRRLGMTREEFFNTYFTGQKELSVMAAMGPTEREEFLSQLLGYGVSTSRAKSPASVARPSSPNRPA